MVRNLLVVLSLIACSFTLEAAPPKPAYEILPASTQAVIWLPDSELLTGRWSKTQLSKLAEDPQIKAFWTDQQGEIEEKLTTAGWKLHIQPRDLGDVVSGQLALAWVERPEVVRKPYALVLIVDVIQHEQQAANFLLKLDNQLKERGSQRVQLKHSNIEIAQHTIRPKGGELLPQETFYAIVGEQLLASDDLITLQGLIDAALGKATDKKLDKDAVFTDARQQLQVSKENQIEYFVRPLGFARILRAISGKRGGGKTDILAVLQAQGFDTLKAVVGEIKLGEDAYDVVHRGFVMAPGKLKDRPAAVQLLDFPNETKRDLPKWISQSVSSVFATTWNAKDAFWKVEPLVDAVAGQPNVFHEIIEGIRVDPTGPQIDIRKDVLPLLTNEIYAVSEAKLPIKEDSKRNLIALRVTDSDKMTKILNKAMSQEVDATEISIGNQKVWKVQHKPTEEGDFGDDFKDFANKQTGAPPAGNENQPLLSDWAITVHDGFLLFASHEDIIKEAIEQAAQGQSPLAKETDYIRIAAALETEMGKAPIAGWRINRSALAYRAQYELFKQGKQGKGMVAIFLENLFDNKSEIEQPKKAIVNGDKLPPFEVLVKYLQPSGTYIRTMENGWSYGSLLLSANQPVVPPPQAENGSANAANKPVQNAATTR